jgi:hypothetical protein
MPLVVLGVDIRFVPTLEAAKSFRDRMSRVGALHAKRLAAVRLELEPQQARRTSASCGSENDAQCSGTKPLPSATNSSSGFLDRRKLVQVGVRRQAVVASQRVLRKRATAGSSTYRNSMFR